MEKHWHKNDKIWTEEEITQFIIDQVGFDDTRPQGHNLLIKMLKKPKKTVGGILIPETLRDNSYTRTGYVLAMGPYAYKGDRFNHGAYCNIGDLITFQQFEYQDLPFVEFEDFELILVPCNKITTVLKSMERVKL